MDHGSNVNFKDTLMVTQLFKKLSISVKSQTILLDKGDDPKKMDFTG